MFFRKRNKEVRAQRFVLEDEEGQERAVLAMDGDGNTVLCFRGPEGNIRMYLGVTPDGTPRLRLGYADGKGGIELEASDTLHTAALTISGPGGSVQVALGIARNGLPAIVLMDAKGKVLFPQGEGGPGGGGGSDGTGFDWDDLLRRP